MLTSLSFIKIRTQTKSRAKPLHPPAPRLLFSYWSQKVVPILFQARAALDSALTYPSPQQALQAAEMPPATRPAVPLVFSATRGSRSPAQSPQQQQQQPFFLSRSCSSTGFDPTIVLRSMCKAQSSFGMFWPRPSPLLLRCTVAVAAAVALCCVVIVCRGCSRDREMLTGRPPPSLGLFVSAHRFQHTCRYHGDFTTLAALW